jgi:hypothetical protein
VSQTLPVDSATPVEDGRGQAPLSVRLVDRFGRALAGAGLTRRRFLGRAAIVGSALAVNPLQYVLKPVPAYASVCGEGASCNSGWTAFCCTVNNGANTCPPGSLVAGWWKIDRSPFCRDAPRYIIDCNRSPGASCSCRCADGACDRRRVCCNVFRYGQCNTQIGGVTEVVCRVVTCATPWEWDPACNRTVRTDNRTVTHNASCLPGRYPSHIEIRYQDLGLTGSFLGSPTTPERDGARGGRYRRYESGSIYWSSDTGARYLRSAIDRRYRDLGATGGRLRYPRTDPRSVGDGHGILARFQQGTIYWSEDTDAQGVIGRSDGRYRALDGPQGVLRYPTTSTSGAGRGWRLTRFERGEIHESPDGVAVAVSGPIHTRYRRNGGPGGTGLGYAVTHQRVRNDALTQRFEHGWIVGPEDTGRVRVLRDRIAERYRTLGLAGSDWGVPVRDQVAVEGTDGEVAEFAGATVYDSPGTGVRALTGPILARYLEEGGPTGRLGFPTTDVFIDRSGQRRASFEHGAILTASGSDTTRVVGRRDTRPASDASRNPADGLVRRTPRTPSELTDR